MLMLRRSVVMLVVFTVIAGFAYTFVTTGVAQGLFPYQANGSVTSNGSALIGQAWHGTKWFHGRPGTYNGEDSGGSNLGPRSKTLEEEVAKRRKVWLSRGVDPTEELVTGSGSALDPDISPASAYVQIPMVARARRLSESALHALVSSEIVERQFGFAGAPYVDVLQLNEALARLVDSHRNRDT